jgi:hypothetical protein
LNTRFLSVGLFFATLATLLLETLDARLLSVLTWYHLSFFAVSLAMLGMAGGAVFVFLHPERFSGDRAPRALARATFAFALAIPISHLLNLSIPFLSLNDYSLIEGLSILGSTVILAVPFVLSGVAITLALTRCGGSIGRLYAVDLIGAAAGCMLVVPLLEHTNISSAIFLAAAGAAVAAACFHRFASGHERTRAAALDGRSRTLGLGLSLALAAGLAGVAVANTGDPPFIQVIYPKNPHVWRSNDDNQLTRWNSHSYVLVHYPGDGPPFLWGPGLGHERFETTRAWMLIDGEAGTPITKWDGDPASIDWVSFDVTSLPYYLRRGAVAVIGVGGGRDIIAALWGRNPSIVGIDVNQIMIDLLEGSHREFANIAPRPEVTLVHDDGRAYLTRSDRRFDIIQMSLVDTWASTGAGAFTLSENGLYTREAWRIFLDRLQPGGVLSVSRWFDPENVSETSRLVALGVAALLDRNIASPAEHLMLVVRERVATLLVSTAPFSEEDQDIVLGVAADRGFHVVAAPWLTAEDGHLDRIARSQSYAELHAAAAHPLFDYRPPTDSRPYYFNMLKPRALFTAARLPDGGTVGGNLRATVMLIVLLAVATLLVSLIIVWPLARAGRPPLPPVRFAITMAYFATIGFGYMLVQIGLLQRFAIYLGHPTYTLAIVLFSMLLFTGIGSFASERVPIRPGGLFRLVPVAIAAALVLTELTIGGVLARTSAESLPVRTLVVLLFAAPLAVLLGMCFPFGVRLVRQTPGLAAWAWGVNGAFGVLASIIAVAVSIWIGIDANFWLAAAFYFGLTGLLMAMARRVVS